MAKKKKHKTNDEKSHLKRVAALGCIACLSMGYEDTPAEIHHLRNGAGAGQKSSHFRSIPLCLHHHREGENAFHKSKVNFENDFGTEEDLLIVVNTMLGVEHRLDEMNRRGED